MKRRIVCLLTVAIVLLTHVPLKALAGGNQVQIVGGSSYPNVQAAVDNATNGQTIQMNVDCTENVTVPAGKSVTIDLNGHILKAPDAGGSVITVSAGATLTLTDSGTTIHKFKVDDTGLWKLDASGTKTVTGGCITGGTGEQAGGVFVKQHDEQGNPAGKFTMKGGNIVGNMSSLAGGGVYLETGSTFDMEGGSIIGNVTETSRTGGGVGLTSATFTMTGGKIEYNVAAAGGGVYSDKGTFTMTDGEINNNTATGYGMGGGVGIGNGTFTMTGGKISGNNATSKGGGVYYNNGTVTLGGTAKITDNTLSGGTTANNLYLPKGKTVTLGTGTGEGGNGVAVPTTGFSVGVTTLTAPTETAPVKITTNGTADDVKYFTSDNADYEVKFNTDHLELAMKSTPSHTHTFTYTANDGKLTATCTQGCDKGYDTTPLTLTLTAPTSLVYDGNAKVFTFADGEAAAWTGAGLELPTITYYQKYSGQGWYTQLNEVPVNAGGNYMAEIVLNNKAAQVKFTIDKATPYIKTNPAPTDINYGDKLSKSTLAGGYVQASSTNSAEVGGLFEWTNLDTMPAIADSEVTLYDVTFTPADTNNYNSVSCKVTITVNHTHNLVKVDGQAATEEAAGWKDYYECKDNEGALGCGVLFEDADGNTPIDNLDTWKAQNGNGYIAQLVHTITPVSGQDATDTEAGFKPYYECKNCGKYYEDEEGKVEITDISAWKAEGGDGYIPSGNEIAAAKDAAKKALDAENAKDPLLNEIALTSGKSVIDSATTLEDIENAKKEAIAAIQEAQADELAAAKTAAKKVLDEENAKDPLLDDSSVVNGKSAIDKAATKAAVESAKEEAIAAIQEAQEIQPVDYIITEGSNVKINLTKLEDTLFTSNADFSKFKEVLVDGKVIDPKYYDAKSGSTDITLKKAYLKTLAVGEHTLTIASTDGSASTKFYISKAQDPSPDTGDNTNIALWSALTTVSFAVLIACIEELKKKKKHNL